MIAEVDTIDEKKTEDTPQKHRTDDEFEHLADLDRFMSEAPSYS